MLRSMILMIHIASGIAGLLLGPAAVRAAVNDHRDTASARAYRVAVMILTASAAGLVALRPGALWPFLLLAVGTAAAVLTAGHARRVDHHIRLVGGSYISLVTALLVVSWGSVLAWILPTLIGTVLVERAAGASGRRPPARTPSRSPTPSSRP
jgi:hypothetical protein